MRGPPSAKLGEKANESTYRMILRGCRVLLVVLAGVKRSHMYWLKKFLFPKIDRKLLIRVAVLAFASYAVFGYVLAPVVLTGHSMEPTYRDGQWNLCFRLAYIRRQPAIGDVVCIRWVGRERMYMKRIVATAGQTVEFRNGVLFVDERQMNEPYAPYKCDWELGPRKVEPGCVYVIGDNRGVPLDDHVFGQVTQSRIEGTPLW